MVISEGGLQEQDNGSRWLTLVWLIKIDLPFLCCFKERQDVAAVSDRNSSRVMPFMPSQSLVV